MKITQTDKKITESEVMLTKDDLEMIITDYFKQMFNAKASELSITFEEEDQGEIQVSYRRVEIVK
jgi:hypothetical protein